MPSKNTLMSDFQFASVLISSHNYTLPSVSSHCPNRLTENRYSSVLRLTALTATSPLESAAASAQKRSSPGTDGAVGRARHSARFGAVPSWFFPVLWMGTVVMGVDQVATWTQVPLVSFGTSRRLV